jgi:hypothetical protein
MDKKYINDKGFEVPENKILVVPQQIDHDGYYKEIIEPLAGKVKRDWFNEHFYYCLPINIGNQYGFLIRSLRDLEITWDGSNDHYGDLDIKYLNNDNEEKQTFNDGFSTGVLTIQNHFALKTPPGINLMTIQPPNMYIPGTVAMTGIIETDQIRRDFTFNLKVTIPHYTIRISKGDPLGAFIPIPRYFVDPFEVDLVNNYFDKEIIENEINDAGELGRQRINEDKEKPHESGRKYFRGEHAFGEKFKDHQKRVPGRQEL